MSSDGRLGIGVIGCGGFGLFALQQFTQVSGLRLVAMAGTAREAAVAASSRFGIAPPMEIAEMLGMDEIDIVYIATPPFLHYQQAMQALNAGKHVIVEKPLALTLEQADEMIASAGKRSLMLTVDLMQRYNPVYSRVSELIRSGVLGDVIHGYFENYANDQGLAPEHWFWDRTKSGGIFVEHGVHFFDMFEGWLGAGEVEGAQVGVRPGTSIEEQVSCIVRYPGDVLVGFYHGFHQTGRLDRQELRLVFERGDVILYEWIPTKVRINALVDEGETRAIMRIFPESRLNVTANYGGEDRHILGRHKEKEIYQHVQVTSGEDSVKLHIYGDLLRAMMTDQMKWLEDRRHRRLVTENNGRSSLRMALAADRLAHS